jgi:hypothetical protein
VVCHKPARKTKFPCCSVEGGLLFYVKIQMFQQAAGARESLDMVLLPQKLTM